jgi:hypothetical protein
MLNQVEQRNIKDMNRSVLIILISWMSILGIQAQTTTLAKKPNYPMRTVNKTVISTHAVGADIETTNMYEQVYNTKTRVSDNTFSTVPSMQVNTIRRSIDQVLPMAASEPADLGSGPRKIRGQQRAIADGDEGEKEPDTNDPMTPVGDIPWLLIALLALGCGLLRRRRSLTLEDR